MRTKTTDVILKQKNVRNILAYFGSYKCEQIGNHQATKHGDYQLQGIEILNFLQDLMFKDGATLVIWYRGSFL